MNKKFVFVGLLVVMIMSLLVGAVSAQGGGGDGRGGGRGGRGGAFRDGLGDILQIVADATGLDAQEIRTQLQDGATLADLITANGGDVNAVIADALAVVTEQVNQAVTDGKITQERADEILANAETRITEAINNTTPLGEGGGRGGGLQDRFGDRQLNGVVRQALEDAGLTQAEIREQLQNGASLRQILTDVGVDVDALIADVLANAQTRLDEAVVNGQITAEQATERITQLGERLNTLLDRVKTTANADV